MHHATSISSQGSKGVRVIKKNAKGLTLQSHPSKPWLYFDKNYYILQCIRSNVFLSISDEYQVLQHYVERGANLGLSPNPLFDEPYYRSRYPDIAHDIRIGRWASGFDHFIHVGAAAGNNPTWFFDGGFYQTFNKDLTDDSLRFHGFSDCYTHYLVVGITEMRPAHWTVQLMQTLKEDFAFPLDQAQLCAFISNAGCIPDVFKRAFDYEWMKERYDWDGSVRPDNFMQHYLLNVKAQRLSPSPYFDEAYYLSSDTGIEAAVNCGAYVSGYEHFTRHGINEWRRPFAAFDPHYYFETNMVSTQSGIRSGSPQTPFTHFLNHRRTGLLPISKPLAAGDIPEDMGKGLYERRCALNVARLAELDFTSPTARPDVSIIMVIRNNYEQTANCIVSAAYNTRSSIEVVVFDNASTDDSRNLPSINPQLKYLRAEENLGFTIGVNRAAKVATGRVILLLNNDCELTPGAIDIALKTLEADRSIGAIGAKIIRMHGRLQEGGSLVWRDGTCLGYGRDTDPISGQVSFVRNVDFCSGCFLAITRAVWEGLGGFDEAYAPAYYEETDFCLRVWESGRRVVYDPRIVVWHFEFGSSSIREEPLALMRRNQRYFVSKHRAYLSKCLSPSPAHIERARLRHVAGSRILFIEDLLPEPMKGAGFGRSAIIAKLLAQACGFVSILGLHNNRWPTAVDRDREGRRVEILTGVNVSNINSFFHNRIGVYDIVWVSRTHNLRRLKDWRSACPEFFANMRIVLDTEAIAATRRFAYAQHVNQQADLSEMVADEMEYVDDVDHICVVNELDHKLLLDMLSRRGLNIPISVLGYSVDIQPTLPNFVETTDIVLVGSYSHPNGPNADGLLWFDRFVRPQVLDLPGLQFVIAGNEAARFVRDADLQHDYRVTDNPSDMAEVFRTARVMVAPTRFAAGVPIKVYDAASHGVPVVMTDLLAQQLGWRRDDIAAVPAIPEPMAAAIKKLSLDPAAWQRSQASQVALMQEDCSPTAFETVIRRIIADPMAATNVIPIQVNSKRKTKSRET